MVGPRVANHVLETLHTAYPDRFQPSQTLQNYAEGRDEIAVEEHNPRDPDEILDRALDAVADEVHPALLLGAGWPFWLGGITKHLDQTGRSERMFGKTFA